MNLFFSEIVTPPARLPLPATDEALAAAVVEECERTILYRAIVAQERRILIDGPLPPRIEIEPATVTSLTMWTPGNAAAVIDAASYYSVTRDPSGTIIAPSRGAWPEPERKLGSFALTYMAGWEVTDTENHVPPTVKLLIEKAVAFRAGSGLGDIQIGSLDLSVADSYKTDRLPAAIASIGAAFAYRPGIFVGRP